MPRPARTVHDNITYRMDKIRRIAAWLAMAWLAVAVAAGQDARLPKREFRGAWLQVINGAYMGLPPGAMQARLLAQLDSLQAMKVNAVLFQVRPEADALYRSALEPWSRFLTGRQGQAPAPEWDPLAFMVRECHRRGMELHAWMNPYRAQLNRRVPLAEGHVARRHPEWFVAYGNQLYFDPGLPESRRHILAVVRDVLARYDVDGIHLDDYFYPYPVAGEAFADDASFARYGQGFAGRAAWRRENVNLLVKELHACIRAEKPWVKFGIAPFGIWRNAGSDPSGSATRGLQNYDDLYADVLEWVRRGWVDYLIPQLYWEIGHAAADYAVLLPWWAEHAAGRPLFIGQDVARTVRAADPSDARRHQLGAKLALQRATPGVEGMCYWSGFVLCANEGQSAAALAGRYHRAPALQPRFPFIDGDAPRRVRKVRKAGTPDGAALFWASPKGEGWRDEAAQYVVYRAARRRHLDTGDPAQIAGITRHPFLLLPARRLGRREWYAVTALDRLGNESRPVRVKVRR